MDVIGAALLSALIGFIAGFKYCLRRVKEVLDEECTDDFEDDDNEQ